MSPTRPATSKTRSAARNAHSPAGADQIVWEQFVYQTFGGRVSESEHRRLRVVLAISRRFAETGEPVLRREVAALTPELAGAYATKTGKTLTRDLNAVTALNLVRQEGKGLVPTTERIQGLWPEVEGGVLFP